MSTSVSHKRPQKIHFRSPNGATLLDVRKAMAEVKTALKEAEVPAIDIACAEIVLSEVLNNIVKHAQQSEPLGWFDVKCVQIKGGLHVTCKDNGKEMPGGVPPGGVMPSINRPTSELPEGGWGWSLVRALTQNLTYTRVADTNLVTFKLPETLSEPAH